MSEQLLHWLERAGPGLVETLSARLAGRAGSVFRAIGAEPCTQITTSLVEALRDDLRAGKDTAIREAMLALTRTYTASGLGFADLRHLVTTTRAQMLASLAAEPGLDGEARQRVEEWLFQLVLVGTMRFVAQREQTFQEQTARLEMRQLESQLDELKAALGEKTRLLDVIRQASTPIAPVYDGILVVPLVGVLDADRTQLLTERLLHAVAQARAKVVILDISGVPLFDAEAAEHIVRMSGAVRLLGAQLIVVGLSPQIAQSIVQLGVDLTNLKTLSTLQAGLAQALALRRLKIAPG